MALLLILTSYKKFVQDPLKYRFEDVLEDEIPLTFFFDILLILNSVEGVKGIEESRVPYAFLEHTWVTVVNRRIRTRPEFYKMTSS